MSAERPRVLHGRDPVRHLFFIYAGSESGAVLAHSSDERRDNERSSGSVLFSQFTRTVDQEMTVSGIGSFELTESGRR